MINIADKLEKQWLVKKKRLDITDYILTFADGSLKFHFLWLGKVYPITTI